ncbi:MAG: secretin N-terminal domain-containing protein [Pirellulaceae bacterium]
MEAVNHLLVKLGELPGEHGNPNTIRVQDSRGDKSTAALLRQLKQLWPEGANPLRIESIGTVDTQGSENSEPDAKQNDQQENREQPATTDPNVLETRRSNSIDTRGGTTTRLTGLQTFVQAETPIPSGKSDGNSSSTTDADSGENATANKNQETQESARPPITISVTADGRLILSSADTEALDALEELINRLAPPPKKHRVFYLQYALASMVTLNLEEYFEDEKGVSSEENWMRAWYDMDFKDEQPELGGLSRRRPVRFIYDIDTNSVLVRDATPQQMETIEELIEIYDKAPSEESISARRLKAFKLKYSDAEVVATTIKDVFRDLLSSKDKEFAGTGDKDKQSSSSRTFRIFGGDDDKDEKPTKVKASFEGALSVGVDKLSNSIIVSAQEDWMPSIEEMIEYLDENAKPDTTVVVQSLKMPMNAESMQALAAMLRPWPGNKKPEANESRRPEPPPAEKPQPQQPNRGQENED